MTPALTYELAQARMQDVARVSPRVPMRARQRRLALRLPSLPRLRRARRTLPA
ncbi:MAG TPA: hypothetical protein VGF25_14430 [Thermoleophilaceae bacterium]|jgi:hypothetical protein